MVTSFQDLVRQCSLVSSDVEWVLDESDGRSPCVWVASGSSRCLITESMNALHVVDDMGDSIADFMWPLPEGQVKAVAKKAVGCVTSDAVSDRKAWWKRVFRWL